MYVGIPRDLQVIPAHILRPPFEIYLDRSGVLDYACKLYPEKYIITRTNFTYRSSQCNYGRLHGKFNGGQNN
jgi:hypothetical protein